MRRKMILLSAALLLLVVQSASAMSSDTYRIDWFTPATGSGGRASSAGYQINFTVGQTASKNSTSSAYQAQMGYWAGIRDAPQPADYGIYLPQVMRKP
jgi:hypothetical protein